MSAETFVSIDGQLVNASLQPPFHDLQGAFTLKRGKIVVDMVAAREIARDAIRRVRNENWPRIDAARARAVEDGEGMDLVRARSAILRDATKDPRIEAAQTPSDLTAVIVAISDELAAT